MGPRARRAITGILLLDKPSGITSSSAVQEVKRLFRAAKAGHSGTLDPLATGMLPVCLGEATKLCAHMLDSDKRYTVRARVGSRTSTGDAEGEPVAHSDSGALTREALEAVLPRFTGELWQQAPMYSARKHEGRRLYELAREGLEVAREPHFIRIHALRLTAFGGGTFNLDVRCSKGTYIRTLVEDLAAGAGQAAHVEVLRREEVAPFGRGPMVTLDEVKQRGDGGMASLDSLLLPPLSALMGWRTITVDAEQARCLSMGQAVRLDAGVPSGQVAIVENGGALLGLGEVREGGVLASRRWLAGAAGNGPDSGG